ncbi:hypothetical protein MRX96_025143 [Rhipicephalus microplus]
MTNEWSGVEPYRLQPSVLLESITGRPNRVGCVGVTTRGDRRKRGDRHVPHVLSELVHDDIRDARTFFLRRVRRQARRRHRKPMSAGQGLDLGEWRRQQSKCGAASVCRSRGRSVYRVAALR